MGDGSRTIQRVDVLWLSSNQVAAAFEVEFGPPIFPSILRMADLISLYPHLDIPLFVVAPDEDRKPIIEGINRPVFSRMNPSLPSKCRYISYTSLSDGLAAVKKYGSALRLHEFLISNLHRCEVAVDSSL